MSFDESYLNFKFSNRQGIWESLCDVVEAGIDIYSSIMDDANDNIMKGSGGYIRLIN